VLEPYTSPTWEETWLWIRDKSGRLIPFVENPIQRAYDRALEDAFRLTPRRHALVLKYRRGGITTREQARSYRAVATQRYQSVVTVAQEADATTQIFEIARTFDELYRGPSKRGNKREIRFDDHSSAFRIGTAGKTAFGRGATYQRAHLSEVAFWPARVDVPRMVAAITEAASHGEVIAETTPGAVGDWFYTTWKDAREGRNDWATVFLPWWHDPTLRVPLTPDAEAGLLETLTEREAHLRDHEHLDARQLAWRRLKKRQLRNLFGSEYPEDPITCFLRSGLSFFDVPRLSELIGRCRPFVAEERYPGGKLRIWHPPEEGEAYSIGVDASDGIDGGDYSCAGVLRDRDGEQVAELHGLFRPRDLAHHVATLGRRYHTARLAVEKNEHGHAVLLSLTDPRHEDYPRGRLYRAWTRTAKGALSRSSRFGWTTNAETRTVLLGDLARALEGDVLPDGYGDPGMKVNSPELLEECFSFRSTRAGRYEAEAGRYDDRVMAWGIAWQQRQDRITTPGLVT